MQPRLFFPRLSPGLWFAGLGLMLLLSACSTGRKAGALSSKAFTKERVLEAMIRNQNNVGWMDARARIAFDDGSFSARANADIRLQRDSLIWVAVNKLGFEVARVLITPDSAFILDRVNKEFTAESIAALAQTYQLPADFAILQNMLLGNPVFFNRQGLELSRKEGRVTLQDERPPIASSYQLDDQTIQLREMAFRDHRTDMQLVCGFEDYQQVSKQQNFAYFRKLELTGTDMEKVLFEIKFSDVVFDIPKSVKFDIPDRYRKTN